MRCLPRPQKFFVVIIAVILLLAGCYSKENFASRDSVGYKKELAENISDQNLNKFLSSIKKVDGNVEAKYRMARYFQKRNRHKIALEELKEIIRMDPTFVKAYNAMGISYEASGDFKKAIQSYETALKINPNLDYVHNNIGFAYFLKGNYDLAIDAFQKAIVLNNHNKRFRNNLGFAYAKSGQFDRALEQFRLTGDEFSANYKLGQILYREGQYEEALKYSEKAYQVQASAQILSSVSNADKDKSPQAAFALEEKDFRSQSKLAQSNAQQAPLIRDENKTAQIIDSDPEGNRDDVRPADQIEEPQRNKIIVEVEITVSNGNGIDGMASRLGNYLSEKGFRVTRLKNAKYFNHEKTKIFYYNGYLQEVQRLLQEIPWHQDLNQLIELKQTGNQIKILIGKDAIPFDATFSRANSTKQRS